MKFWELTKIVIKSRSSKVIVRWHSNGIQTKILLKMQNKCFRKYKKLIQYYQILMKEHGTIIISNKF